jgi:hypothetical protein
MVAPVLSSPVRLSLCLARPGRRALAAAVLALGLLSAPLPSRAATSALWGEDGEAWTPSSRLPDFSYAGYHMGETALPQVPVWRNLKTHYGAKGDGVTDDTAPLLRALKDFPGTTPGALYLPPGRYVLSSFVALTKSHLVLRGAGPGQTTLFFTKPVRQVGGPCAAIPAPGPGTQSVFGGLLCVGTSRSARSVGAHLTAITSAARRGTRTLTVATSAALRPGQKVVLVQYESADRSLGRHIHAEQTPAGTDFPAGTRMVEFVSRVQSVQGTQVVLQRPLRLEVRPGWRPALHAFSPTLREVGIEELALAFASNAYVFHKELGYNGVQFLPGVADCWLRNVTVFDTDNGHTLGGKFCTVVGARFAAKVRTTTTTAHHFFDTTGTDNLVRDFTFTTRAAHDITVVSLANGNVFARGRGVDINFDHHCRAPYENLFSDINVGLGTRVFKSDGLPGTAQGPHSGARETFWNVRTASGQPPTGGPAWPQVTIIGNTKTSLSATGPWFEAITPAALLPQDLYPAQDE